MAYDKVIDSAKLNSAMTATANAIREKTGDTNTILWNENTGFTSAVEAIQNGGDNSLLLNLMTGEDIEFAVSDYVAELDRDFGNIQNVSLLDVNTKRLDTNSIPISVQVLILRYDGVTTLASSGTVTRTWLWDQDGYSSYGGKIYVPQSYISQYTSATNWSSVFNGSIELLPIEGSEYE